MITAVITMGKDYSTQVSGKTIDEVLDKIRDYHTMTDFMKEHYSKKGKLQKEMKSGWYIKEKQDA